MPDDMREEEYDVEENVAPPVDPREREDDCRFARASWTELYNAVRDASECIDQYREDIAALTAWKQRASEVLRRARAAMHHGSSCALFNYDNRRTDCTCGFEQTARDVDALLQPDTQQQGEQDGAKP